MEGPSLVIACEELNAFAKKTILDARGTSKINSKKLINNKLTRATSWGKHLLLSFKGMDLRIHFLMFGSYRINDPRENRVPKLQIDYESDSLYFYSCAIKEITKVDLELYDYSIDLMSPKWNTQKAVVKLRAKSDAMVCDLLMDQTIFSGLGNIMKNEILFKLKIHPETRIRELSNRRIKALATESKQYSTAFYRWKKKNELKKNWRIMRKKICPDDGSQVTKKPTGKLKRMSHFCRTCQLKQ